MVDQANLKAYWQENLLVIFKLLIVWFIFSFIFGIFFADYLNTFEISGVKLGYFLANQGLIYLFIFLIYIYIKKMSKLDEKYSKSE